MDEIGDLAGHLWSGEQVERFRGWLLDAPLFNEQVRRAWAAAWAAGHRGAILEDLVRDRVVKRFGEILSGSYRSYDPAKSSAHARTGTDRLRAWVTGVCQTGLLRHLFRASRLPISPGAVVEVAEDKNDIMTGIERRDQQDAVARAMQRLSATDREILTLRYFDGLSVEQVATRLGCTKAAAGLRLLRARQRLKQILSAEGGDNCEQC